MSPKSLHTPTAADVRCSGDVPEQVMAGHPRPAWKRITEVVESWQIDDQWWTERPVRREYYDCLLQGGSRITLFRDLGDGGWYVQR